MKANLFLPALLVLLAVAMVLRAQPPATNAAGTSEAGPWTYDKPPKQQTKREVAEYAQLVPKTGITNLSSVRTNAVKVKPPPPESLEGATNLSLVATNAFGFVPLPVPSGTTNAASAQDPPPPKYSGSMPLTNPFDALDSLPSSVQAKLGLLPLWTNAESVMPLRNAAEQGDAYAQIILAYMYNCGLGVPQDFNEEAKWNRKAAVWTNAESVTPFRKAAEQGGAYAQSILGFMYERGVWVAQDFAEAIKWYRKAADQGNAASQIKLGGAYLNGWMGVTSDFAEGVNWYRKAAEQGNAMAQYTMGGAYRYGWGVATNDAQAVNWYRKAAENGDASAQIELGDAYSHGGLGVATNFAQAVTWYRKAAEQGNALAQNTLGDAFYKGKGVPQDYAEAVKWYRKAADQANADAEESLASCYSAGQGVAQDPVEADKWYQKAAEFRRKVAEAGNSIAASQLEGAEKGNVQDQLALAFNLKMGIFGQKKDPKEAAKWYRAAAEQGDARGQWTLGTMYADGDGIDPDTVEAARFLAKAAEQGDADYESMLAYRYFKGKGVVQDYREAAKWFRKAADQGNSLGESGLAVLCANGNGVPKNDIEAYKWFSLAAANGDDDSAKNRDRLTQSMSRTEIVEGQRLAREFVARKEGGASDRAGGQDSTTATAAPRFTGTGFFVSDDGYLLTCYHVIQDAGRIAVRTKSGTFAAKLVKSDKANDIALLKVGGTFPTLPLGLSRAVKLGQSVFTIGFPNIELQGFAPKLTKGEINSLTGAQDDPREFQISVAVQPGNSGGPLVNQYGNVVGIVSARLADMATLETTGSLPQNVNYAVKSSVLNILLESLPEISAKLIEPHPAKDRQFDDVEKEAENAAALVLVY